MATAAVCPVSVSTIGKPTLTGGSTSAPLSIIMPLVACTMLSIAGQSRWALCWPYPDTEQNTMSGRSSRTAS